MTTPAVPSCSMARLQPAQTALGPASTVSGSSCDAAAAEDEPSLRPPGVLGVAGRKPSAGGGVCMCEEAWP